MSINPFREKLSGSAIWAVYLSALAIGLFWTGNSAFDERIVTVRYLLFALSGFLAFVTPYILFPDSKISVIQLGNVRRKTLLHYTIQKLGKVCYPLIFFLGVLLMGDLHTPLENIASKFTYVLMAAGIFGGLMLLSLSRYLQSGESSQFWKESEKGRELRRKAADYFKFPLDPGSVPSLINTVLITFTGMTAVVISAVLSDSLGPFSEMGVGIIIFFAGAWSLYRTSQYLGGHFYQSNAFYREFFGADLKGEDEAVVREVEQLWWVPRKLKAHVWQFLVQLDRVVPSGRVVGAGHALVWFIAYQKPDPQFIFFVWLLFGLAHQFFAGLALKQELAPYWLLRWVASPATWFFSRFWMQLRWLLPLVLSMNVQLFVFGTPEYHHQMIVITAYLVFSMIVSAAGTIRLIKEFKT